MSACVNAEELSDADRYDSANRELKKTILSARRAMIPENYIQRVIQFAQQGFTEISFKTYDTDWDSEAYLTVAGQNSNNSVRVRNVSECGRGKRRLGIDPAHGRRSCRESECV